jgi:hypothetical protein
MSEMSTSISGLSLVDQVVKYLPEVWRISSFCLGNSFSAVVRPHLYLGRIRSRKVRWKIKSLRMKEPASKRRHRCGHSTQDASRSCEITRFRSNNKVRAINTVFSVHPRTAVEIADYGGIYVASHNDMCPLYLTQGTFNLAEDGPASQNVYLADVSGSLVGRDRRNWRQEIPLAWSLLETGFFYKMRSQYRNNFPCKYPRKQARLWGIKKTMDRSSKECKIDVPFAWTNTCDVPRERESRQQITRYGI